MKTKIMISAMVVLATATQGFAELSSATSPALEFENTIPEPGAVLFIAVLLVFKAIRKV